MKQEKNMVMLVLFLLGIFMGAIDNGIVSPAREIIENSFDVERNIGMWMITIYSLSYAIAMPIISKLSDRYGHKRIYAMGIFLFGFGSLICGLTNFYGNFAMFLAARVVQAIGAGGIMPIANTVIGLSFPEEKRGTALGMVGAIYGVATIVGPMLGSAILDISGSGHWGWIFFINVPISITILVLSGMISSTASKAVQPMDLPGAVVAAGAIGSIMYALTNLDVLHFIDSIKDIKVFPYLIAFAVLVPVLILIEGRAKDPILNLKYFKDRQLVVVFLLAFIVGLGMMGMVFVPQFAENVLKLKAGSGGYLVTLLAVFSGIAAPVSGKLLDKYGARFVLGIGFMFTIIGTLFLGYVAVKHLNLTSILIGLGMMGFGVGFTLGAPLNYLVLQNVPNSEGATALATMSLIRSIGVAISPSLMIGFIVNAAKELQPKLMDTLQQGFAAVPGGGKMPTGASGGADAAKLFEPLQSADVTNIVDRLKDIFKQFIPPQAQETVVGGIEKLRQNIEQVFQSTMNSGYTHMFTAAAVIAAAGLAATALLRKRRLIEAQAGDADMEKMEPDIQ